MNETMSLLPFINLIIILDLLLLMAGLIRPWWVLWFMYKQNRLMVLQYYGATLVILLIFRLVTHSNFFDK